SSARSLFGSRSSVPGTALVLLFNSRSRAGGWGASVRHADALPARLGRSAQRGWLSYRRAGNWLLKGSFSTLPVMSSSVQERETGPKADLGDASRSRRSLVLVAGSGRSGTSLFSGILQRLGFYVPQPEVRADDTNPRGFAE